MCKISSKDVTLHHANGDTDFNPLFFLSSVSHILTPAAGAYPVSTETSPVTGANIATCAHRMPATALSRRDGSTPPR